MEFKNALNVSMIRQLKMDLSLVPIVLMGLSYLRLYVFLIAVQSLAAHFVEKSTNFWFVKIVKIRFQEIPELFKIINVSWIVPKSVDARLVLMILKLIRDRLTVQGVLRAIPLLIKLVSSPVLLFHHVCLVQERLRMLFA